MDLWPHQTAAIGAAKNAIKAGRRAGLWSMPTGTGKTAAFSALGCDLDLPTLVMVHRDELIRQTVETLGNVWPTATVGVVQADRDEWERTRGGARPDAVIASVPSLHERRLARMPRDRFGFVVADEAHHAVAPTWAAVLDHFDAGFVLGATATPERADGKGLSERFGRQPLYSYGLRQAIEDGHLARLTQYAVSTSADLDGVAYRAGDFAIGELSGAVNTPERNAVFVEAFEEYAPDRRALAFAVDVAHAEALADAFNDAGVKAAFVTGATPRDERRARLADFAAGTIRVMANCMVLTEGFDDPAIDCVLMARPTASAPLYTQAVGRGLRRADGKSDCLVIDFVDNSRRHKLVTVLDLLGAVRATNARGGDVIEAADRDREVAEQERIVASTKPLTWRLERVCPWPAMPSLLGYGASAGWHNDPATEKQTAYLRRFGVEVGRAVTRARPPT